MLRNRWSTWFLLRNHWPIGWTFTLQALRALALASPGLSLRLLLLERGIGWIPTHKFACHLRWRVLGLLRWLGLVLYCVNKFLSVLSFIFVWIVKKIVSFYSIWSHWTPWLRGLLPNLWLACSVICPNNVALSNKPFNFRVSETIEVSICQSL